MKNTDLFGIAWDNATKRIQILKDKNHDYAGEDQDALKNFKVVEFLGLCNSEVGVLVRMCDKMSRLATLVHTEAKVNETFDDTLTDLANYCDILSAIRKEKEDESVS